MISFTHFRVRRRNQCLWLIGLALKPAQVWLPDDSGLCICLAEQTYQSSRGRAELESQAAQEKCCLRVYVNATQLLFIDIISGKVLFPLICPRVFSTSTYIS